MYSAGDYILYNGSDVCRVVGIGKLDTHAGRIARGDFYFLETQFCSDTICVPVDTKLPMRLILTKEEALALIDRLPLLQTTPCLSSDKKRISDHYAALTEPATCEAMARTAKTIYLKYHASGRSRLPNSTEAIYYKKASTLLLQELSISLGESIESVKQRVETVCSPNDPIKWNL